MDKIAFPCNQGGTRFFPNIEGSSSLLCLHVRV